MEIYIKPCKVCKEIKSLDMFQKAIENKDRHTNTCRSCLSKRARLYRQANYEKVANIMRDSQRKSKYGITKDQYLEMVVNQNYCCGICGKSPENKVDIYKSLSIDHDHESGKIRGLLCSKCNTAVGLLKDNYFNCIKAARYLKKHRG